MLWVNGRSQLLAQLLRAMPSDVHGDFGPHSLLEIEMVIVGRVGHKTTEGHIPVFIGRPSVLDNPFLIAVVKKAFFDININEATQAIADVVAEAAEYFGNNDFDVFIIKIRNN